MTEHNIFATPRDARILLKRFFWFNLRYGLLAAGGIFVPFLSISNYLTEKSSIDRQVANAGIDEEDPEEIYDVDSVWEVGDPDDEIDDEVLEYDAAAEADGIEDEIIDVD